MSKLMSPSIVWVTLFILFTSTLADPQTDNAPTDSSSDSEVPTTTVQDVGPLISAIAALGTAGSTANGEVLIGSSITAIHTSSNALVVGTATLTAGGAEYTTDTYTISLGPSDVLDINSQTTSLPPLVSDAQTTDNGEFIIGSSITAIRTSSDAVVIGAATLTVGGSKYTTDTYTLSLGPSGILDINSQTTSLPPLIPADPTTSSDIPQSVVTSTMTSAPPDVSTQIIHPPDISTNTWITTSKDGESTIVPGIWSTAVHPAAMAALWSIFGVAVTECPPPKSDEESSSSEDGSNDDNDDDDNNNNDNDDESNDDENSDSEDEAGENEDDDTEEEDDEEDDEEECTASTTITDCRVGCSVSYTTSQSSVASSTVCYTTTCMQTTGCDLRPTTSSTISTPSQSEAPACAPPTPTPYNIWASYSACGLQIPLWMEGALLPPPTDVSDDAPITTSSASSPVTSFISCSTQQPDPGSGINSGYCVCEGSTFAMKTTGSLPESCAYTALPETTINPTVSSVVETKSELCQVCTYVGENGAQCGTIADCTPSTTVTAPPAGSDEPADTDASPTEVDAAPPYPTFTDSTGGTGSDSARCNELVDPGSFSDFTMDEAAKAYESLLDRGNVLAPEQIFAYSEGAPNAAGDQILASVEWAADQSACEPQTDFDVSGVDCQNAFENILNTCVGTGGKGGGFVWNSPQGCLDFQLAAPISS